jgi:hypothetical protein
MAHTIFRRTATSTECFARCPKCKSAAGAPVREFSAEPVLQGDGKFVEVWHLTAHFECSCGWSGSRSVGTFQAEGD